MPLLRPESSIRSYLIKASTICTELLNSTAFSVIPFSRRLRPDSWMVRQKINPYLGLKLNAAVRPLIHPDVDDCHEIEKSTPISKEARQVWQERFEHLSSWIPKWKGKVSQITLKTQGCKVDNIPVAVSKHNSDWFLWWVPHPHICGKTYSYHSLSVTVDDRNCAD